MPTFQHQLPQKPENTYQKYVTDIFYTPSRNNFDSLASKAIRRQSVIKLGNTEDPLCVVTREIALICARTLCRVQASCLFTTRKRNLCSYEQGFGTQWLPVTSGFALKSSTFPQLLPLDDGLNMIREITSNVSLKSINRLVFVMKTHVSAVAIHFQLHFPKT
jgi:hypothetical protein